MVRTWCRGDWVEMDGLLGVVVAIEGDPEVPEDHVAVWFGDPRGKRLSQGGIGGQRPEVWTVPVDCIVAAARPIYRH